MWFEGRWQLQIFRKFGMPLKNLSHNWGTGHHNFDEVLSIFQQPFFQLNTKFYCILLLYMHFHFHVLKHCETWNTTKQISRVISSQWIVYCIAMVTWHQLEVASVLFALVQLQYPRKDRNKDYQQKNWQKWSGYKRGCRCLHSGRYGIKGNLLP